MPEPTPAEVRCLGCHGPTPCACGTHGFSGPVSVCHCGRELYAVIDDDGNRLGLTHPMGDDEEHCLDRLRGMSVRLLRDEEKLADA